MQIPSANVSSEEPRNLDTLASETCVNTIDKLTNRGCIGQILELCTKTLGAPRNTRRLAYIEVGICGFNEVLYFISNLLLCKLTYSIIRPGLQTNPQFIEPLKRLIEESSLTISIPRPPVCFEAICSNQVPVVANSGHRSGPSFLLRRLSREQRFAPASTNWSCSASPRLTVLLSLTGIYLRVSAS